MTSFLRRIFGLSDSEMGQYGIVKMVQTSWGLLTPREKLLFTIRFLARMLLNSLDLVAVALMGLLGAVTATGLSGQRLTIFGYSTPEPSAENVTVLVSLVALLFILKGGLSILFSRWTAIFLMGVEIKNSAKIARYMFSGSLTRLKMLSRAEIAFLVGQATSAVFSGVLGALTTFVIDISLFLSIFVMFLLVDWVAAVGIALYFVILIAILQRTTASRYLRSGRNARASTVDAGGSILEMVDGYREIAVLSKQDYFLARYVEALKLSARTGVILEILKSFPRYIAESGLILGAVAFTLYQLNSGTLAESLLAIGIFLAGSLRMMGAVLPLQAKWNSLHVIQDWAQSAQKVLVEIRDDPEVLDANIFSETSLIPRTSRTVEISGALGVALSEVVFTHLGKETPAINSVSLNIVAGSYVAIVGPSGAGKTTLVDLLLGLYDPDFGSVRVGDEDPRVLREVSPGLISYVPQRPGLVSGSLAQNVALGVVEEEIDENQVREVLAKAQLLDFVDTLPQGIHSSLGAQSDSLSGGQIQRLGFARALYTRPRLIILDEATSSLDAATEASVAGSIKNVGGETTVVVIAHRLSTIQDADQVHVMDEGRIIASGTFLQVRKAVPMVEEYVQLMSFRDE